jgi:hypothetical protein
VNIPWGVCKSDPRQLKHNGVISMECVASVTQARTVLPLRTNPRFVANEVHRTIAWDDMPKVAANVISLLKAKEVRLLAFALRA